MRILVSILVILGLPILLVAGAFLAVGHIFAAVWVIWMSLITKEDFYHKGVDL